MLIIKFATQPIMSSLSKKNNETERNVPINKEEIDKEIDAMVAGQGETEK